MSPMKNCVTSPPTGIMPPMPIGHSQANMPTASALTPTRRASNQSEVGMNRSDLTVLSPPERFNHHPENARSHGFRLKCDDRVGDT